jgi:23S rRNA (cytosine1962-C5)-methyltransferase
MTVKVTARGAERWKQGHPWIYRSDVADEPEKTPGIVPVTDRKGKFLGQALYSPQSEIRLRLLTRGRETIDAGRQNRVHGGGQLQR